MARVGTDTPPIRPHNHAGDGVVNRRRGPDRPIPPDRARRHAPLVYALTRIAWRRRLERHRSDSPPVRPKRQPRGRAEGPHVRGVDVYDPLKPVLRVLL
jgi:hypothetical protein